MAEDEPFLARWSRLKRKPEVKETEARDGAEEHPESLDERLREEGAPETEEPFDLASLPKIEELTGETDIRKFMDVRVPPELRHAALRRAWTLDPGIRDFIEMAENQYDWNAPGGVPGFGPIDAGAGTIESVVAKATELGRSVEVEAPSEAVQATCPEDKCEAKVGPEVPASASAPSTIAEATDNVNVTGSAAASPRESVSEEDDAHPEEQPRRRHGGALPT